jgi:small subunit ribosomal protein S5
VEVTFKPAPRGIGLATGDVAKKILKLAGVADCWGFTEGKTKTVVNYAKSVFDALMKNAETRITPSEITKLGILQGSATAAPAAPMAAPPAGTPSPAPAAQPEG